MTGAPGKASDKKRGTGAARGAAAKKKRKRSARVRAFRIAGIALLSVALLSVGAYFLNIWMEKNTYRLAYAEAILRESEAFGLDPYLVAAVIHCESRGQAEACSPKGARGLMQIMPATGEWISEKLALASFTEDALYEADVNIRFGCWHLSYLLEKYDGEKDLALAAYNAGPGT